MVFDDLLTDVMGQIPNLQDGQAIHRALNIIITQINGTIRGIRERLAAIEGGVVSTGYVWDSPELTIPRYIKEIIEVWVSDGLTPPNFVRSIPRTIEAVMNEPEYLRFCMPGSNVIQFAASHKYINEPLLGIFIIANRVFDRIDVSDPPTELDFPATWDAGITAGVIANITLTGQYKEPDIHSFNRELYFRLLAEINEWEMIRYPQVKREMSYNYHQPGR